MERRTVPFNRPDIEGRELFLIAQSVLSRHMSGSGTFTEQVRAVLEKRLDTPRAFLTPSCTAALEMAALLCDIEPGDEVILPSFTFVSTANAFVLRGARPVFVDVREDTLNMDERLVAASVTSRTRVIAPVHYAGVSCDMDPILEVARGRGLKIVEDAAQAVGSTYRGRPCGTLGDFGAFSFHETKVFMCGEGGALAVASPAQAQRAEVVSEKGTDRSRFLRGEVDKYTWREPGSSYLMADICAAFLLGQLERWEEILSRRRRIYLHYLERLQGLAARGDVGLPHVPDYATTNAHIFFVLAADAAERSRLFAHAAEHGVNIVSHYIPLHLSPYGRRFGQGPGDLPKTEDLSARLGRLPLYNSMSETEVDYVCDVLLGFYGRK